MERPGSLLNARNVSLVTILAAASAATIYLLNSKPTKTKGIKHGSIPSGPGRGALDQRAIDGMMSDLKARRETILRKFEENKHRQIPDEMNDAMKFIRDKMKDPRDYAYPAQIRLLCSQLIQDYAIMVTNVKSQQIQHPSPSSTRGGGSRDPSSIMSPEPPANIINLAKLWLDFKTNDVAMVVEQINHRYALALRSRSIREFALLAKWLKTVGVRQERKKKKRRKRKRLRRRQRNRYDRMDDEKKSDCSSEEEEDDSGEDDFAGDSEDAIELVNQFESSVQIQQNLILRNFQCACLLGRWDDVISYGHDLESIQPELLASQSGQSGNSQPLHPLHLFEYIALKLPNQSANFTQTYYNASKYKEIYCERFQSPLKFTEWQIHDCTTRLIEATSSSVDRQRELLAQIERTKAPTKVKSLSRFMFVYGSLVQFPCFWVQLPAGPSKVQPVVLCGPWNDADMEMTASYVRRYTSADPLLAARERRDRARRERRDDDDVQVVRSDLRLTLTRSKFSECGVLGGSDSILAMGSGSSKKGWIWTGLFDHVEGLLTLKERDLTAFSFRKQPLEEWIKHCSKFTRRTWAIQMIIASPG